MRPAVLVARLNCNPSRLENFSKHCHSSFACDQNGRAVARRAHAEQRGDRKNEVRARGVERGLTRGVFLLVGAARSTI